MERFQSSDYCLVLDWRSPLKPMRVSHIQILVTGADSKNEILLSYLTDL